MIMKELYAQLGISSAVYDFGKTVEDSLKERFEKFDKTAEYNQMKVIHAMQKNRVSEACFGASSGYGYYHADHIRLDLFWQAGSLLKLWSRFMPIPSTQKPAWYARRSPVELMHLPLLSSETCAPVTSFFPL